MRNNFVVNGLLLKQAAGNIQGSDVTAVNSLLVSDAESALDLSADDSDIAMPGLPVRPVKASELDTPTSPDSNGIPVTKHKKKKATHHCTGTRRARSATPPTT